MAFIEEFLAGMGEAATSIDFTDVQSIVVDRPSSRLVVETADSVVAISGWRPWLPSAGEVLALLGQGRPARSPRPESDLEAAGYTLAERAGLVLISADSDPRPRFVRPGHVLPMSSVETGEPEQFPAGGTKTFITPRPHGRTYLLDLFVVFFWALLTSTDLLPVGGWAMDLVALVALIMLNLPGLTRLDDDGVFNWRWYGWKRLGWEETERITTGLKPAGGMSRLLRVVVFRHDDRDHDVKVGIRRAASRVAADLNRWVSARGVYSAVYAVDLDGSLSLSGKRIVRCPEPWPWELF